MTDFVEGKGFRLSVAPPYYGSTPGIQVATKIPPDASDEYLQFVQQLGVEWGMCYDPLPPTVETLRTVRERFESHGLKVYSMLNFAVHNMPAVVLNLPERDQKVAEYLQWIRTLGAAGVHYTTYGPVANGIWSSGAEPIRGGALSRGFHLEDPHKQGHWDGKVWDGALTHRRVYSEQELWDNYAFFIRQVVPVAEENGVYIGIHPDDPPVPMLGGVPRPIFSSFGGFKRALEIADSPHIGMCLCVGCWLEGGKAMGRDVIETIRYFGARKKILKVHFRNITKPIPEGGFVETYPDAGFMDMHQVMRALREVDFDGGLMSDHLPQMVGGYYAAEAYHVGYIKALVQSVNNEFGGPAYTP